MCKNASIKMHKQFNISIRSIWQLSSSYTSTWAVDPDPAVGLMAQLALVANIVTWEGVERKPAQLFCAGCCNLGGSPVERVARCRMRTICRRCSKRKVALSEAVCFVNWVVGYYYDRKATTLLQCIRFLIISYPVFHDLWKTDLRPLPQVADTDKSAFLNKLC